MSLILDDSKKCKTSIATVKLRNHLQIGMHLILAEKQKKKKDWKIMKVVRLCSPFLVSPTEIRGPKERNLIFQSEIWTEDINSKLITVEIISSLQMIFITQPRVGPQN